MNASLPFPVIRHTGRKVGGRAEFELVEDFTLDIEMGFGAYRVFIPKGTTTDFGSVPWMLRIFISEDDPLFVVSWMIHDDLYRRRVVPRFFADATMRFVQWLYWTPLWKRLFVFYAVRLGGWMAWKNGA